MKDNDQKVDHMRLTVDMTGLEKWSIVNYARDSNLTVQPNGIYMHKPKSVLENEMHKVLWNFEIQTVHLIPARRRPIVD